MTDESLLKEKDVAELIDVHQFTLSVWRRNGQGPEYIKIGKNVRYRRSAIDEWLEDRTVTPRRAS
jgi:predicted DNA-binding transcriptional regulator AlpA